MTGRTRVLTHDSDRDDGVVLTERKQLRVLDLFCGAGGAAMGYHRAFPDAEIVGVDIEPQPRYPFTFIQADAMTFPLDGFDLIHASPPCQRYSDLAHRNGNAEEHPDLIAGVRRRLEATDAVWIIENVQGSPLHDPTVLCGVMFDELRVLRHRLFESNATLPRPPRHGDHPLVFTYDKRKSHYGELDQDVSYVQVTGGGNCTVANARDAMGIDWMVKRELNEAIPPCYTEWIARQLAEDSHPKSYFCHARVRASECNDG